MLNNIVWSNGWSKWLLTFLMWMLIVCSLSMLVKVPANAAEKSDSESIGELFKSQRNKPDSNQLIGVEIENDFLSERMQALELEENAIDSTTQTNLGNSNTTRIETEEFTSPLLSVAELSTPDITADVPLVEHSVTDQQADKFLQPLEENQSVIDRTDLNPSDTQENEPESDAMGQVTSVTQLSDVQPTDWAFQALQGLVERYGCIAGYPDGTYRGQSAMTRYEFAAGLNACLDRISELIATSTADLATQEDLATLQRLQEEFAAELVALRSRVDGLESQVAELEETQFSTNTILRGNAIFAVSDVFGEDGNGNNMVGRYRLNLNFITSFTGRDVLLLGMFAGNAPLGEVDVEEFEGRSGSFELPGTEFVNADGLPISFTQSTSEGSLSSDFGANTNNQLQSFVLGYSFPVGENLNIALASASTAFQVYAPTLNPYLNNGGDGTGAISVFGENNPIYALSGGGTGIILNYDIFDSLKLTAGYLADGLTVANPEPGNGLFNGGYGVLGQLTWNVTDNFSVAGVYVNDYARAGRFGFNYNGFGVTGTAVANTLGGQDLFGGKQLFGIDQSPVVTNGYGVQFNWQPSSRFSVSGWFSTFYPRLIGEGDGNILTYALTFAFPDLGKEGNLLGLVVGAEPYLTEMSGDSQDFDVDVPLHLEAFYQHQIGDHIFVTPGIIWLTAPNQDQDNGSAFIGTLRTTFIF